MHIYIPTDTTLKIGSDLLLPVSKITKVEVIEKNKGKSKANYILSGFTLASSIFLIVGIIIAATKSSCPFVSAYDGTQMKLQGEIYGGCNLSSACVAMIISNLICRQQLQENFNFKSVMN